MMKRDPQRRGVRQYNRSDAPRMQWTEELHARFVDAVHCLGGHDKATPKRILQLISVKGVSISHVKSHLQMYRNMSNRVNFHSFLSTKALHRKKKLNLDNINPSGCDHPDSLANSSNGCSFTRTSLEESSIEWEQNFDMQCFYKDNGWIDQNQVIEMDLLSGRQINNMDNNCELTLCTYPTYQLHNGLEQSREGESIVDVDIDDDLDIRRNKSDRGHATQNHCVEGCINLELTIS